MDVADRTLARKPGHQLPLAPDLSTGTISRPNEVPIYSSFVDVARTVNYGRINQILAIYFPVIRGGLNHFPGRETGSSTFFGNGRSFSLVFGRAHELVLPLIDWGLHTTSRKDNRASLERRLVVRLMGKTP